MASYVMLAVLCALPLVSSMFLPSNFAPSFELSYDMPDTKLIGRNGFGQLQAYDVSGDQHFVRNAAGQISRYNVLEISPDADVYTNTVPGAFPGLPTPLINPLQRFGGRSGIVGMTRGGLAGLGATGLGTTGLGLTGLGMTGLGTTGLGPTGLGMTGLGMTGLGTAGLGTTGLGTTGLGTTGLTTTGLGTVGLGATNLGNTAAALRATATNRANNLKMPMGTSTLNNYISSYSPFRRMY